MGWIRPEETYQLKLTLTQVRVRVPENVKGGGFGQRSGVSKQNVNSTATQERRKNVPGRLPLTWTRSYIQYV